MCGCATNSSTAEASQAAGAGDALTLKVDDMTCGHCANAVKAEIESHVPGAKADVDLASKLVSVRGIPDLALIEAAIVSAGYTPTPVSP